MKYQVIISGSLSVIHRILWFSFTFDLYVYEQPTLIPALYCSMHGIEIIFYGTVDTPIWTESPELYLENSIIYIIET